MKIEVKSLEVRQQVTKKDKTLHWQKVGTVVANGEWPVVFDMFLPDGKPLPLGQHEVHVAFKADTWGSLLVDPFNTKVVPGK